MGQELLVHCSSVDQLLSNFLLLFFCRLKHGTLTFRFSFSEREREREYL